MPYRLSYKNRRWRYNCEECILTDTVSIKREYMLGKGIYPLCPLEMKTDVRVLK